MTKSLIPFIVVFVGGMALSVQAPINAALGQASGSGLFAAGVSFIVGFCLLAIVAVATGGVPSGETIGAIPWWMWTGGAFGACYVWAALTNVTKTGTLSLVAALIAGQLLAALVIDAVGFLGVGAHAISWQRVAAVVLVGAGALLSRY